MAKINILIADDHPAVRAGTRHILEAEDDLNVVAEAADGREAIEYTLNLRPDVAIMDIAMPGLDGIEATKQIKMLSPDTAVLIYTVLDNVEFITRSREVGASGYLLKSVRQHELIEAIRQAHER